MEKSRNEPIKKRVELNTEWVRLPAESPFRGLSMLPPGVKVFSGYRSMPFDETLPKPDPKKPRA